MLQHFFFLALIRSTLFNGSSHIYDSCFWWNIFFSENVAVIVKDTNFFDTIMQLIDKIIVKQLTTQEKLLQRCIFYPIAKDSDLINGIKMQQKLLFWIFTTICHQWTWFA